MVFLFSLQFPAGGLKLKIIVIWKPGNFSPKNNTFFDWSEIWFTVINSLIIVLMQDFQFFPTLYVFFLLFVIIDFSCFMIFETSNSFLSSMSFVTMCASFYVFLLIFLATQYLMVCASRACTALLHRVIS